MSITRNSRQNDLENLFPRLLKAFGDEPDCLGIVIVNMQSVPEYITLRKTLLSYSSYLAALPSQELKKLENSHAKYVVGWSHGKEKAPKWGDRYSKRFSHHSSEEVLTRGLGSYYVNPTHNAAKASRDVEGKVSRIYRSQCMAAIQRLTRSSRKRLKDLEDLLLMLEHYSQRYFPN